MNPQVQSIRQVTTFALDLMAVKERRYLVFALISQFALGFADLLGVFVLGILSSNILSTYLGLAPTKNGTLHEIQRMFHLQNLHLMQMASLVVVIFLAKSAFSLLFSWKLYMVLSRRANTISNTLLDNFLKTPFIWVRKMDDQTLPFAFMEGINALVIGVIANMILLISDVTMMLILLAGLVKMNFLATLISGVLFGSLTYVLIRFLAPRIKGTGHLGASLSIEGRNAILDIKELFQEFPSRDKAAFFEQKAQSIRVKSSENYAREQWLTGLPKNILETAAILGIFVILIAAGLTGSTQSNVAMVTVFLGATARIMPAILRVQSNWLSINRNVGYVNAAMPVLLRIRESGIANEKAAESSPSVVRGFRTGGLTFEGVGYAYPDATEATVAGLDFDVKAGEKIAIIGDSGAGKTTLANLILGLFEPTRGRVVFEERESPPREKHFSETGYLPQTPFIFSGSVLENVCLTDNESEIDLERFERSLADAQIGDFIGGLSEKSQTILGPTGTTLSGGEKQRLALARVLYLRPSIIVLDEPTSSLDSETDEFVSRTLMSGLLESTVFVIAHKYSTVKDVDRIVYLENGKMVAYGTWDQLIATVPRFAMQAKLQGLS